LIEWEEWLPLPDYIRQWRRRRYWILPFWGCFSEILPHSLEGAIGGYAMWLVDDGGGDLLKVLIELIGSTPPMHVPRGRSVCSDAFVLWGEVIWHLAAWARSLFPVGF